MQQNLVIHILNKAKLFAVEHNYIASFTLGIICAFIYQPFGIFIIGWLVFPLILLISDYARGKKHAFFIGWWFGFGNYIAGIYWISISMLVEADKFAWMMPFAIFGVSGFLAIFTGLVFLLLYLSKSKLHIKILSFALLWLVFEYVRGHILTGFPWNLLAHSWSNLVSFLQIASYIGVYGVSFLSALIFAFPYVFIKGVGTKTRWLGLGIPVILFASILIYGNLRLSSAKEEFWPSIKVRIVQASIPLVGSRDFGVREKILYKYLGMSGMDNQDITHIIWPESAIPFAIEDKNSPVLQIIKNIVPKNGFLLSGYDRAIFSTNGELEEIYNSMIAINDNGNILESYDKHHLVPFGEYVPLRKILPIDTIVEGTIDISKGVGIRTLSLANFPRFSPLICYEAIFPNKVADKNNYPQLLINFTNDAWFGNSSGPYQHLANIAIRAIEQGVPIIRSANNGISAVIDPYGRIIASTKLNAVVNFDQFIPKPLNERSFYSIYGDITLLVLGILSFILIIFLKRFYDK